MHTQRIEDLIEKYAPARVSIPKHERITVMKLACVIEGFMRAQIIKSCQRAENRPLLWDYGGDLTPMLKRYRKVFKCADEFMWRERGQTCEWNLHRQIHPDIAFTIGSTCVDGRERSSTIPTTLLSKNLALSVFLGWWATFFRTSVC